MFVFVNPFFATVVTRHRGFLYLAAGQPPHLFLFLPPDRGTVLLLPRSSGPQWCILSATPTSLSSVVRHSSAFFVACLLVFFPASSSIVPVTTRGFRLPPHPFFFVHPHPLHPFLFNRGLFSLTRRIVFQRLRQMSYLAPCPLFLLFSLGVPPPPPPPQGPPSCYGFV